MCMENDLLLMQSEVVDKIKVLSFYWQYYSSLKLLLDMALYENWKVNGH